MHLLKICVSIYPHQPRNSQGKNRTCPQITSAMDHCEKVKTRHLDTYWVSIIKKKSGNDKVSWKFSVNKIWFELDKFKISECVWQTKLEREHGRVSIIVSLGWRIYDFHLQGIFKPVPFLPQMTIYNLTLRAVSNCLFLGLNKITFVFAIFNMLFAFNQKAKCFKSLSVLLNCFTELCMLNKQVLSAKWSGHDAFIA